MSEIEPIGIGTEKPAGAEEAELQLYRLLVSSVRDYAIFALDATGHIVTWNLGAERLKGYKPHEIIGKHFSTFYLDEDRAARKPDWELREAAGSGRIEDEGWRIRKDGTRFWASVVITALRDETGKLVGFAKVTRDLTERKASEQQAIEDARRIAEAEAANRTKGEFLAAMSHELRTPLNAIGGYADLLAMRIAGDLTTQQAEYVSRIRRSQQHLLGIINDLLNYSRLEAGQVTYSVEPVSLSLIVTNVLPMIEPQATQRNLSLDVVLNDVQQATGDRTKIEQIVLNLLSNAVKFTPAGGRISVTTFRDADLVGIRITDTGIGIPAEKLESIFEPFVQVGRSLVSPHEGAGLGLAISRDLARAMGGELTVESEPGVGSTFNLVFPVVRHPDK